MPKGVIVKAGRLNVNRRNCFVVSMRNQRKPGGPWELVQVDGFVVVASSKLEAHEMVYFIGGQLTGGPPDPHMEDEAYLDWLLRNFFRVHPYEATNPDIGGNAFEIWFHHWLAGWRPGVEDVNAAASGGMHPAFAATLEPALRAKWQNK
jgi:hypothetical protein